MTRQLRMMVVTTAMGILAASAASAKAAVISDGTFSDVDWTHSILWSTGTVTMGPVGQVLNGGNPNEYQQGRHTHQSAGGLYDGHLYVGPNATHDPATQGAIASIDVSYDYKDIAGVFTTQHGLLIEQGPRTFIYFVDSNGPYPQWTNLSVSGIVDTWNPAWLELTGGVQTNFTTPDFSSNGLPLKCGYYTFNGHNRFASDQTWGIDNFRCTIRPVPEPVSFAMLALGTVLALAGRHSRRRGY